MPRYKVTLTDEERDELKKLIQKGGKGYRIKHAHILLKLDEIPENADWTYARIKEAYIVSNALCYRGYYCCIGSEEARKLPSQSNRRCRSTNLCHSLL